ncbi:MAG: alpha-L-fucosidase [Proteiniphilum sp.]|jgi:alpha-L-fucosidase|uniref:alpha-L-fucosidase n=1 Tax=Proteiniphilum sp. TaxID=1926877 RepID=UPI002B2046BB|nr:alpha-L-fucosidase [Proteiniphilum sp.]MEA5129642.1 alpha-L-fucosidase [Proteiniphilum sp.]
MKKNYPIILIISCMIGLWVTGCQSGKSVPPPAPLLPVPSENQLAWHEMEMNAFIHFTTNTFTGKEWGYGDESPSVFNPSELDTDQWISVLKETGFKGVILTCKHHDGFCLWPSEYTEHSVKNSPYKDGNGDIVKEVSDACKKYGLKFGVYLSPWDRNHKDYGNPGYITYYRNQLKELFTGYGSVFEMWFDGANGGDGYYGGKREIRRIDRETYYDWPATLHLVRGIQPEVVFFSDAGPDIRWIGNERGYAGETNWNTITPDTLYAGKAGIQKLLNTGSIDGSHWIPGEVDVSIRPGWFYHAEEDSLVKTPEQLFDIYLTSVGRGAVLLLNVPPDRRGLIHENDVRSLQDFGELLHETFSNNLASGATVKASGYRGKSSQFSPNNLIDGDKETYWTMDDDAVTGSFELEFSEAKTVSYVLLQEYIPLGQRIKSFRVEVWNNDEWETVSEATTIGHKRILQIKPVKTSKIRINITDSKACPVISNIELY